MCYKCSEKNYQSGCKNNGNEHEKILELLHLILEKVEEIEEHLDENAEDYSSEKCSYCSCNK